MATRHIDIGSDRTRKHHTYSDGEHKYPGVTGITGCLPKPFLVGWAARMTAELAVDSIDYVGQMVARDRKGAVDYLSYAHTRYTNSRADLGSRAHVLFEQMMRGETPGRVHPDLEQHKAHFAEFLDAAQPTLLAAEDIAWSDTGAPKPAGRGPATKTASATTSSVKPAGLPTFTTLVSWPASASSRTRFLTDVLRRLSALYRSIGWTLASIAQISRWWALTGGRRTHTALGSPNACVQRISSTKSRLLDCHLRRSGKLLRVSAATGFILGNREIRPSARTSAPAMAGHLR